MSLSKLIISIKNLSNCIAKNCRDKWNNRIMVFGTSCVSHVDVQRSILTIEINEIFNKMIILLFDVMYMD